MPTPARSSTDGADGRMTMEIAVPQTAVEVSPGVETRVRIRVSNTGDDAVPVRIGLARGRVATWAQAEPAVVSAGPGESTGVDLVFRPPATATPASTLQPFTVQAEDMRDGSVRARATGLLAVSTPATLTAALTVTRTRRRRTELRLTLTNTGDSALTVRVRPAVESVGDGPERGAPQDRAARKAARRAAKRITAKPAVLDLAAGAEATARIRAKPRRAFIGTRLPFVVKVRCVDAADDVAAELKATQFPPSALGLTGSGLTASDQLAPGVASSLAAFAGDEPVPPLATVTHAGVARPRLARVTATVIGLLLVGSLTGGAVYLGREGDLPALGRLLPGGPRTPKDPVSLPYAMVGVFPKTGGNGGLADAEAARDDLNGAGMQVRVVDSTTSQILFDGPTGLWVVLRDGFVSAEAVDAYCDQYAILAPGCQVVVTAGR
jgi:Protein of unknown function (DUF4232)